MSALNVLVTGNGLLGQYLNLKISEEFNLLTLYHINRGNSQDFNSAQIDLTRQDSFLNLVHNFNPDVIIHNAAITSTSKADDLGKEYVNLVNVNSSKLLAEYCEDNGCKLIFCSTDLVYDGSISFNLTEKAKINPVSLYAASKLEAEKVIKRTTKNYVILRLALMFGFGLNQARNHFHLMVDKLRSGQKVVLFEDQFRSPLELSDSARMISEIIKMGIKTETINFGGCERLSRYDLGLRVCEILGLDKDLVIPSKLSETQFPHKVFDVSLNTDFLNSFGIRSLPTEDLLKNILRHNP